MSAFVSLLTLIKYFIDAAMAAYKLISGGIAKKKENDHDNAVSDLKNSKTDEEQKDATREMSRNP